MSDKLMQAAAKFRDAFNYDPGHSDLDNEQPIHVTVTLGDWRALNFALNQREYVNGDGWIDAGERLPNDGEEVLLYHCLGDSRRGEHAYDVATYLNGEWIFPWDRGELNPKPRWAVAWMPIEQHPSQCISKCDSTKEGT